MKKNNLMIPIFWLYEISSLEEVKFTLESSNYIKDGYGIEERNNIYEALQWAKDNPNYNFKGIMKNAPVPHKLEFSNKEVYYYLMKFKEFMENKEYEILTDDRPTIEF
ncbi:hypothetical protein M2306_002512 [Myroides gitamensis]|uniref:hypothetical protein n=1 Tax=Myroides odoratus TaxID=256 RepID=UPI002168878D|nr:hypothetical protein [Myroides odoratus]MCS4237449.1 hypothetical protein [Myroides odoratus]MDH6601818.1 hypothetical protein [Myroides gitamensis]